MNTDKVCAVINYGMSAIGFIIGTTALVEWVYLIL